MKFTLFTREYSNIEDADIREMDAKELENLEAYNSRTKRIHSTGFKTYADAKMIKETSGWNKLTKGANAFNAIADGVTKVGAIVLTAVVLVVVAKENK